MPVVMAVLPAPNLPVPLPWVAVDLVEPVMRAVTLLLSVVTISTDSTEGLVRTV